MKFLFPRKIACARVPCWTAGLHLFSSCAMLPVTVQVRTVAALMHLPREEIVVIVREAGARHRLDAHWVERFGSDALEIGLGKVSTTKSVVYRRVNGNWIEDPDAESEWGNWTILGIPPAPSNY
jgi:hypothetical protein